MLNRPKPVGMDDFCRESFLFMFIILLFSLETTLKYQTTMEIKDGKRAVIYRPFVNNIFHANIPILYA